MWLSEFEAICGLHSWGVWVCMYEKTGVYAEQIDGKAGWPWLFLFHQHSSLEKTFIYRPGLEVTYTTSAQIRPAWTRSCDHTHLRGRLDRYSRCVPRKKRKEGGEFLNTLSPRAFGFCTVASKPLKFQKVCSALASTLSLLHASGWQSLPAECKQSLDLWGAKISSKWRGVVLWGWRKEKRKVPGGEKKEK